ncbi:response regulator [Gracilibacillus sp. JCM 18860]|uniref:response regulator n=1 Tax=Gracilibacillus sp. JCM 18860 TaxID=1306159 RepID=UPI0032612153
MLKVMLVDDEAIEREGIRLILSRNRDNLEIVAEAQNGKIAVEKALDTEPDIIFMDINARSRWTKGNTENSQPASTCEVCNGVSLRYVSICTRSDEIWSEGVLAQAKQGSGSTRCLRSNGR